MLKRGYDPQLATGVICASGTLGRSSRRRSSRAARRRDFLAYSQAQLKMGNYSPDTDLGR
jgi:hypothetical protein